MVWKKTESKKCQCLECDLDRSSQVHVGLDQPPVVLLQAADVGAVVMVEDVKLLNVRTHLSALVCSRQFHYH